MNKNGKFRALNLSETYNIGSKINHLTPKTQNKNNKVNLRKV